MVLSASLSEITATSNFQQVASESLRLACVKGAVILGLEEDLPDTLEHIDALKALHEATFCEIWKVGNWRDAYVVMMASYVGTWASTIFRHPWISSALEPWLSQYQWEAVVLVILVKVLITGNCPFDVAMAVGDLDPSRNLATSTKQSYQALHEQAPWLRNLRVVNLLAVTAVCWDLPVRLGVWPRIEMFISWLASHI